MVKILPDTCQLWVCEGSSVGTRRKDFDAEIYNRILGTHYPDVLFVSGGSSNQVQAMGVSVRDALCKILPTAKLWPLADRDDKSQAEVNDCESKATLILPQRNLESFLFADDAIEALVVREQKPQHLTTALQIKQQALGHSIARGNPADDLKSAGGKIYTELKKLLDLRRRGNSTDAFMRDTLAPLVIPPITTYQALKAAVIDRVI